MLLQTTYSKEFLERVRAFYTSCKKLYKCSKNRCYRTSMGVTLGRKALKGGNAYDENYGSYSLGSPLDYVDTFIELLVQTEV